MSKRVALIVSAVLLSGGLAVAADWPAFKQLDTNGDGQIDRIEYKKGLAALKMEYAPNFVAMDDDNNNVVDEDEWKSASKLTASYTARCREASASWCKDAK